jgi:hypothetical protein
MKGEKWREITMVWTLDVGDFAAAGRCCCRTLLNLKDGVLIVLWMDVLALF